MLGNVEYDPDSSSTPRTRYYYTDDNLLKQVDDVMTGGGTTSTYMYWDADQQRVKLARGSDTWYSVYDPTAGIPAVLVATGPSWYCPRYYVREPDGELLGILDTDDFVWYYHFDALGSTVLITDGSGGITTRTAYGAWGAELISCNERPYHFVGQLGYYSHLTGQGTALGDLMQLGVRFYDKDIGRFTQGDPIGAGTNPYSYVDNSATAWVDPLGLLVMSSCQVLLDIRRGFNFGVREGPDVPVGKPYPSQYDRFNNVWIDVRIVNGAGGGRGRPGGFAALLECKVTLKQDVKRTYRRYEPRYQLQLCYNSCGSIWTQGINYDVDRGTYTKKEFNLLYYFWQVFALVTGDENIGNDYLQMQCIEGLRKSGRHIPVPGW